MSHEKRTKVGKSGGVVAHNHGRAHQFIRDVGKKIGRRENKKNLNP
jgi:hypothetical protein